MIYGVTGYISDYRAEKIKDKLIGIKSSTSGAGNVYIPCELVWETGNTKAEVILPKPLEREDFDGYVITIFFYDHRETILIFDENQIKAEPFCKGPAPRFSVSWKVRMARFFESYVVEIRDLSIQILEDRVLLLKKKIFEASLPFEEGERAVREVLPERLKHLASAICGGREREEDRLGWRRGKQLYLDFNARSLESAAGS